MFIMREVSIRLTRAQQCFTMLMLFTLLLVHQATLSDSRAVINVNIVTMGQLYPNALPSMAYNTPAVEIAVAEVQELYKEKFNFRLSYLTDRKIKDCVQLLDETIHLLSEWYYKNETDLESENSLTVLISPGCSETPLVNRLVAEWNLLYISTVVTDIIVRDKNISPTYLSVSFISLPEYADTIVSVLSFYKWSTVFIVIDMDSLPGYLYFGLMLDEALSKVPHTVKYLRRVESKKGTFPALLQDFQSLSRVMMYFGQAAGTRKLLIEAARLNMTQGEHVYITYENFRAPWLYGNLTWNYMDNNDDDAKLGFSSLLIVMPNSVDSMSSGLTRRAKLQHEMKRRSIGNYNVSKEKYNEVLNKTLTNNEMFDVRDSKSFIKEFFNRSFHTDAGEYFLSESGERRLDLVVRKFDDSGILREPFLVYDAKTSRIAEIEAVPWTEGFWPPKNEPHCGYEGKSSRCIPQSTMERIAPIIGASVAVFLLVLLLGFVIARNRFMAAVLFDIWWRIPSEDLLVGLNKNRNLFPPSVTNVQASRMHMSSEQSSPVFVALWKGKEVLVQPMKIDSALWYKQQWRDFSHNNIVRLFGLALVDKGNVMLPSFVSDYMERGSLWDLFGTEMNFSVEFLASFAQDMIQGLKFIHTSGFIHHGSITSKHCVCDKYFTIKIADLAFADITTAFLGCFDLKDCLQEMAKTPWTGPEKPPESELGQQQADIFSVGVVLSEIFTKKRCTDSAEKDDLPGRALQSVPSLKREIEPIPEIPGALLSIINGCLNTSPNQRPTVLSLETWLTKTLQDVYGIQRRRQNLVDDILQRLGLHAEELEIQVDRRTADLTRETERQIVGKLRNGRTVDAEIFEQITIMFSDLNGFVEFVSSNPPFAATSAICAVEAAFDKLLPLFDVRKVEAITDSFMTSSGVPNRNGNTHVFQVSGFALFLQHEFSTEASLELWKDQLRVGIHTGPCAAGIVGFRRLKYCLFGDTINTASRMCSHGLPGKVHLSSSSAKLLMRSPSAQLEHRGKIEIKGKDSMDTYWLHSLR